MTKRIDERLVGSPPEHGYPQPHGLDQPRFKDSRVIYGDPAISPMDQPDDDEPPSLHKERFEQLQAPDLEDPSIAMTPAASLMPWSAANREFFDSTNESPPHPGSRSQHRSSSMSLDPNLPEDEQRTSRLASPESQDEQPEPEYDPFSNHLRPPAGEFESDEHSGYYPDQLQSKIMEERYGHVPTVDDYGGEEKKIAMDDDVGHPVYQMSKDSSLKSGEEDFILIKRDGYQVGGTAATSPSGTESVCSHQSAAFRNAQELIRKNRRRRQGE